MDGGFVVSLVSSNFPKNIHIFPFPGVLKCTSFITPPGPAPQHQRRFSPIFPLYKFYPPPSRFPPGTEILFYLPSLVYFRFPTVLYQSIHLASTPLTSYNT